MGSVQDFILFCVWYESREIGGRGSSRFSCVTPAVKTFSSDRVAFRIPSNISDGALLRKQSGFNKMTASPKTSYHRLSTGLQMRIQLEVLWMWGADGLQVHGSKFLVAELCARKWLRLYQTMKNKKSNFC